MQNLKKVVFDERLYLEVQRAKNREIDSCQEDNPPHPIIDLSYECSTGLKQWFHR
jgi:N-acyl-L-homoserine lactone synthetase